MRTLWNMTPFEVEVGALECVDGRDAGAVI